VTKILSGATYLSTNHYLEESQRSAWETYTALDTSNYLSESYDYFSQLGIFYEEQNRRVPIFLLGANSTTRDDPGPGPYLVSFLCFPSSTITMSYIICSRVGRFLLCLVQSLLV
jgi:hypothetical protein